MKDAKMNLVLVPLGGVGEFGKNMWVVGYGEDLVVLDCGGMFPEEEMLGVDLVIPDISYLEENRDRIRAIILSHAHEDHVGALPHVLRKINVPVYGTRLTLGLVEGKLEEHRIRNSVELREIDENTRLELGALTLSLSM